MICPGCHTGCVVARIDRTGHTDLAQHCPMYYVLVHVAHENFNAPCAGRRVRSVATHVWGDGGGGGAGGGAAVVHGCVADYGWGLLLLGLLGLLLLLRWLRRLRGRLRRRAGRGGRDGGDGGTDAAVGAVHRHLRTHEGVGTCGIIKKKES